VLVPAACSSWLNWRLKGEQGVPDSVLLAGSAGAGAGRGGRKRRSGLDPGRAGLEIRSPSSRSTASHGDAKPTGPRVAFQSVVAAATVAPALRLAAPGTGAGFQADPPGARPP